MAKWGEGDPRWIVEERPDATNVNNWHWTEKKASGWSKDKLTALFAGLEIRDSIMTVTIKELSKCEGDASANNRKAKLIFFYEWVLEMDWEGRAAGSDQKVKGKIEIPNLSDENDIDEVAINVTLTDPTSGSVPEKVKSMLRSKGTEIIREKLEEYVSSLKTDFSQGLILPTKGLSTNTIISKGKTELNKNSTFKPNDNYSQSKASVGELVTKKLSFQEEFKCTAEELYRALTMKEMVEAFSRGAASIEAVDGGKFIMFDTNISGKFLSLSPPNRIEMEWRFKSWPSEHHSKVVITLTQGDDNTKLSVEQTGVPEEDFERTQMGWKRYYFDSIRNTFGFGAALTSSF